MRSEDPLPILTLFDGDGESEATAVAGAGDAGSLAAKGAAGGAAGAGGTGGAFGKGGGAGGGGGGADAVETVFSGAAGRGGGGGALTAGGSGGGCLADADGIGGGGGFSGVGGALAILLGGGGGEARSGAGFRMTGLEDFVGAVGGRSFGPADTGLGGRSVTEGEFNSLPLRETTGKRGPPSGAEDRRRGRFGRFGGIAPRGGAPRSTSATFGSAPSWSRTLRSTMTSGLVDWPTTFCAGDGVAVIRMPRKSADRTTGFERVRANGRNFIGPVFLVFC